MNNELSLLVKDIPSDDIALFTKNTKSDIVVKKEIHKIEVDYSWVDVIDEALTSIDNIIRNPKRFIVNEEDVVIIEKTKKVTQESIKHLATHTQLIREVDEEENIKPSKLLNVFKEDTIDLYENRFIFSLIKNLNTFINMQLSYKEEEVSNKDEKSVVLNGETEFKDNLINVSLDLRIKKKEEYQENENLLKDREEKINHIKEVLSDFLATKFMKEMANATPVKSPIRKTNTILKDKNFIKALRLWEFLENFQTEKPVKEVHVSKELTNNKFKKDFNLTYFLNYEILNESFTKKGKSALTDLVSIPKTVNEYAKKFDIDEKKLKDDILLEIENASNYKKEQKQGVRNAYKSFIDTHRTRINKATILIK